MMRYLILTTIAIFAILSVNGQQVTDAEYFWGTDPGVGNGNALLAFDGNFDDAVETIVNDAVDVPAEGIHLLSIRALDDENNWGPVFTVVVNVAEPLSEVREIKVSSAEYYFNNDPGPGNGTPMLAVNGDFSEAIEALKGGGIPSPIEEGIHVLWMRARDAENNWGPSFGVVVNMDTTITGFDAVVLGSQSLCSGDEQLNAAYSTQVTPGGVYTWTATNGNITSGQGTANITVDWDADGPYSVHLEKCLGDVCEEDELDVTIYPTYEMDDELTICFGEEVMLGGAMQSESGIYTDVYESVAGCDSTVNTTLTVLDEIELTIEATATEVCAEESVTLTASGAGTISWSEGVNNGEAFVPTETTNYTVTGTTGDCSATASITIEVTPNPEVSIEASAMTVCDGEEVTLTASGADQLEWNAGIENGQSFVPEETATYTATGTTNGCTDEASVTITVNPNPVLSVEVSAAEICADDEVTLTASGADQFLWSDGVQNGEPFTPDETQSYSVTGTTNGCSSEATVDVIVNPLPDVTLSGDLPELVCVYNAPIELTNGSPAGGTWLGSGVAGDQFDPESAGVGTHTLTYSYTDENDCSAEAEFSLEVDVCTSVGDRENEAGIELYPNPASDICWVEITGAHSGIDRIALHDAMGRIIKMLPLSESDGKQLPVDISRLAPGTYLIRVEAGDMQFHQRLVIAR